MAEKLLKAKKKRVVAKKAANGRAASMRPPRKVVLVGTYAGDQLKAWPGYYPYPLCGDDKIDAASAKRVNEIWLFKGTKEPRYFAAECLGVKTREELKALGYPAKGKGHGDGTYLLFKIEKTYAPANASAALAASVESVIIRTKDFAKRSTKVAKQLKAYLESPDRKDAALANQLPFIVTKLPPQVLRVCEAAVQMWFPVLVSSQQPKNVEAVADIKHQFNAISLFSGAGGLDIGVLQAGFDVVACVELDHNACDTLRCAVDRENRRTQVFEGDIKAFDPVRILDAVGKKPGEVDLLFGGPPCQAFSLIGKQKALEDERGMLLFQMIRYAKAIRPRVVLMEQVKGLLSAKDMSGKRGGVLEKLLSDFSDLGYVAKYKVCLAADYGAAQLRERVILVATRGKNGFEFPPPKFQDPHDVNLFSSLPSWRTVGDALQGLSKPHAKIAGTTSYPDEFDNHVDVTPARDRERIHHVPEGLYLASQTHLPVELLRGLKARDTTKYLRLSRKRPSNTLRCGEIFFHPTEDRYLTPREYMRIHGYPDSYLLKGPIRSRTGTVKTLDQHRLVANSVPPPLAFAMADQIRRYMEESR